MKDNTYLSYQSNFLDRCIDRGRDKIYHKITNLIDLDSMTSILDNGVTADKTHSHSNFFENKYTDYKRITVLSNQDASWMEEKYKGLKFVQGDGCTLPFKDNQFDFVFSSAVLEHVGSRENQEKFISECYRTAKKYVLLTTPNKWYPVEFHSALPIVHWLPKKWFGAILKMFKKDYLADEKNLNLCAKSDIKKMLQHLNITSYQIIYTYFLGFPSNILILIQK